jgi:hypothetical protein
MTLFKIIMQLIGMLGITTSSEDQKLAVDVDEWEKNAAKKDATKAEQLYTKLHTGIYFRLASPFLLIYLKRWADAMLNGTIDKNKDYELRD